MNNQESLINSIDVASSFVNTVIELAKTRFKEDGYLRPITFIGAQINPETGQPFDDISILIITPELLGMSFKNSFDTQTYTDSVKLISKTCKAIMVVNVMEAWRVVLNNLNDRKSIKGSLEHVTGREECIQILMEHHKLGTQVMCWSSLITRDEKDNGHLSEFVGPTTIGKSEGRFLGFITPLN
jgi:hypothetical protein